VAAFCPTSMESSEPLVAVATGSASARPAGRRTEETLVGRAASAGSGQTPIASAPDGASARAIAQARVRAMGLDAGLFLRGTN
jgi:hypothetical protein